LSNAGVFNKNLKELKAIIMITNPIFCQMAEFSLKNKKFCQMPEFSFKIDFFQMPEFSLKIDFFFVKY